MKIHSVVAEVFRTDGRTDGKAGMTKLIGVLCDFVNSPYNRTPVDLLHDTPTAAYCRSKCRSPHGFVFVVLTTRTEVYDGCAVCRGKVLVVPSFMSILLFVVNLWEWALKT